jgi:hypothetical protein
VDVRDIGLGSSPDERIAAHARKEKLCLLTGDFGFADIRNYPPEHYSGIVVFESVPNATAEIILRQIGSFIGQTEVLERLPGRLAMVEPTRVRLRPA